MVPGVLIRLLLTLTAICFSLVRFLVNGRHGQETCPRQPRSISRQKAGSWCWLCDGLFPQWKGCAAWLSLEMSGGSSPLKSIDWKLH